MGCAQSKIENEEAVLRCKERKHLMKAAVSSRNAFAAAHSAYAVSLKNTGAALSDFGQGEVQHVIPPPSSSTAAAAASAAPSSSTAAASSSSSSSATPIVKAPMDSLPPPPPPLPEFPPLQRAASMPDIPIPKSRKLPADPPIREEDDDDADDESSVAAAPTPSPPRPPPIQPQPNPIPPAPAPEQSHWDYFFNTDIPMPSLSQPEEPPPPPPPPLVREKEKEREKEKVLEDVFKKTGADEPPVAAPQEKVVEPPLPSSSQPKQGKKQRPAQHQHAASAGGSSSESKRGRIVAAAAPRVDLLQILTELDDHFLKASESAHDVSKMLEATRMHYHSNFADNRGHIDHSARVMQVITWNRSFRNMPNSDDGKGKFDTDEPETHATVLDKMLAWEKKLYDEVKAGELMKIEYQRKVALLNKQKKRGASSETLEKIKAAVSHLHTRYIVDMQSMDSTVMEINHLRDKQLYPKLVELVDGMAKMWESMFTEHSNQHKIVKNLRSLDISLAPNETSEQHHGRTAQLWQVAKDWHSNFKKLVSHQKEYIQALSNWLKLNLIPTESSLKEKVSSPPREPHPPIHALLRAWNEQLEKLPDELARSAIYSFSEVIRTIMVIQEDELKLKEKCEETRREYMKRSRAFDDWYHKYSERRAAAAASSSEANAAEPESTETVNQNDPVTEKRVVVESLKVRLKDEEDNYRRTCRQVREKSVMTLKTHLPELFRAMSDFALACSEMYKNLHSISAQPQNPAEAN